MKPESMWKGIQIAIVVASMTVQAFPLIAWAQPTPASNPGLLDDVDPALNAAVQALIAHDPDIANNPELADLVRQVAEATVLDPRERSAVTNEVVTMHREGIDINTIIPQEVRDAAREEFAKVQGQMQEQLETLRATDPDAAREMELMMQEGERAMQAFESGAEYTPSPEMVAHAEGMFHDWESEMVAQGAPPEFLDRARAEFAAWSEGGAMQEMLATGESGGQGPGEMPSLEQMQAMVDAGQMTPEQLQMAKDYMANPEGFTSSGGPGMDSYMPEGWAQDQSGDFHYVGTEWDTSGSTDTTHDAIIRELVEKETGTGTSDSPYTVNFPSVPGVDVELVRTVDHYAEHPDGDPEPDHHTHEIYRHFDGDQDPTNDVCHDHGDPGGTLVSC